MEMLSKPNAAGGSGITRRGLLKSFAQGALIGTTCSTVGMVGATTLANIAGDFSKKAPPAPTFFPTLSLRIREMTQLIENRAAQVPADRPLYVLMGESHVKPSHKLAMQGVIVGLREKGYSVSVGMELHHTLLTDIMLDETDNAWVQKRMFESPYCSEDLKQDDLTYLYGDQGMKQFLKFLSAERIPMRNNDLDLWGCGKFAGEDHLDPQDEINQRYFKKLAVPLDQRVPVASRLGLYMRNLGMVDAARAHAEETGARIYIQHTGASHLFGEADLDAPYAESFHCLLKQAGASVLGMELRGFLPSTPEGLELVRTGEAVSIQNLPNAVFDYAGLSPDAEMILQIRESLYIKRLATEAGLTFYQQPRGYKPPPSRDMPTLNLPKDMESHTRLRDIQRQYGVSPDTPF